MDQRDAPRSRRQRRPQAVFSTKGLEGVIGDVRRASVVSAASPSTFSEKHSESKENKRQDDDASAATYTLAPSSQSRDQESLQSLSSKGAEVAPLEQNKFFEGAHRLSSSVASPRPSRSSSLLQPERVTSRRSVSAFSNVDLGNQRQRLDSSISFRSDTFVAADTAEAKEIITGMPKPQQLTENLRSLEKDIAFGMSPLRSNEQAAAMKLQAWWRGRTTRSLVTASLIERRLQSGGPTVCDLAQRHQRGRPISCKPLHSSSVKPHGQHKLPPWPRNLVHSLCDFLETLSKKDCAMDPASCRASTIVGIYNRHRKQCERYTVNRIERKALEQLRYSQARRHGLRKEWEDLVL